MMDFDEGAVRTQSFRLPSSIKLEDFTKARLWDIDLLKQNLVDQSELETQDLSVSFHLRRRNTSHQRRKVPERLKQQLRERKKQIPADDERCRGHRRRPKALREEREGSAPAAEGSPSTWLETHLWHAKRFEMADLWGVRIATVRKDWGVRAVARAISKHCIVHDSSYLVCYELRGPQQALLDMLAKLMDPLALALRSPAARAGRGEWPCVLHRRGAFPGGALGPARLLWRPPALAPAPASAAEGAAAAAGAAAWLWVHPAAHPAARAALGEAVAGGEGEEGGGAPWTGFVELRHVPLVRFSIRGRSSWELLTKVLAVSDESNATAFEALPQDLDRKIYSSKIGNIIGFKIADPRQGDATTLCSKTGSPTRFMNKDMVIPALWDEGVRQNATEAVRATQDHLIRPGVAMMPTDGLNCNEAQAIALTFPLMLIQVGVSSAPSQKSEAKRRPGGGWDVVAPPGWGRPLLQALHRGGGRVVGLRGMGQWALEAGRPQFPQDYPDTEAGKRWWAGERARREAAWAARRPRHRGVRVPGGGDGGGGGPSAAHGPDWSLLFPSRPPDDAAGAGSAAEEEEKGDNAMDCSESTGTSDEERIPDFTLVRASHYTKALVPVPRKLSRATCQVLHGRQLPSPGLAWVPKSTLQISGGHLQPAARFATASSQLPVLAGPTVLGARLTAVAGGRPEAGSLIFSATPKETAAFANWLKVKEHCIKITGLDEKESKQSAVLSEKYVQPPPAQKSAKGRVLVGYITSGGYSFTKGMCTGYAVCEVAGLYGLLLQASTYSSFQCKTGLVFFQNAYQTSKLHPALVTVDDTDDN